MEKGLFSFFPLVSVVCVNVITRRQIATIVWSLSVLVLLWLSRRLKGFLLTGLAFFAPTLALWTISFLSPSCMPLSPATAWWRAHKQLWATNHTHTQRSSTPSLPDQWRWCRRIHKRRNLLTVTWHCPSLGWTLWAARTRSRAPSPAQQSQTATCEADSSQRTSRVIVQSEF